MEKVPKMGSKRDSTNCLIHKGYLLGRNSGTEKSLNHKLLEAALGLCHIVFLSWWHLLCATARDRTPGLV